MPKQAKEERTRLTLSVPQRTRDRLETLQERTGAESMTAVIGRALAVYEALIDAKAKGGKIIVRQKNSERELLLV